ISALPLIEPDQSCLPPWVAVAAMRKEEPRLTAGAEVGRLDFLDARLAQLPAGLAPEINLITAGPDAGTDRGRGGAHRLSAAQRYSLFQAAPAPVHDDGPAGAYGGDRQAVGAEDKANGLGVWDHVAIGLRRDSAAVVDSEVRAVHLPGADDRLRIDAED